MASIGVITHGSKSFTKLLGHPSSFHPNPKTRKKTGFTWKIHRILVDALNLEILHHGRGESAFLKQSPLVPPGDFVVKHPDMVLFFFETSHQPKNLNIWLSTSIMSLIMPQITLVTLMEKTCHQMRSQQISIVKKNINPHTNYYVRNITKNISIVTYILTWCNIRMFVSVNYFN